MCIKGAEQKIKQLREEETQIITPVSLQAYGRPMETVMASKYLGRFHTKSDDKFLAVVANICKAQSIWARFYKILGR